MDHLVFSAIEQEMRSKNLICKACHVLSADITFINLFSSWGGSIVAICLKLQAFLQGDPKVSGI